MKELLTSVRQFVRKEYAKSVWEGFVYHNLAHTEHVTREAQMLCQLSNLSKRDTQLVEIAAWFHDIGYSQDLNNHEEAGILIARKFLSEQKVSISDQEIISDLIMATKIDYSNYDSLLKKIIKDADLSNAGLRGFVKTSNLLRKEWKNMCHRLYDDKGWYNLQVEYLSNLNYLSEAAISKYKTKRMWHLDKFIHKSKNA